MFKHHIGALAVGVVFIAACGSSGDGGGESSAEEAVADAVEDAVDAAPDDAADALPDAGEAQSAAEESAQELGDDMAEGLEAAQESVGGGGATLTVNGQTWEFPSVLCAFGEEQIGQDGAVFNLSAIADGLQLYASIDDSGGTHTLSLNDIKNFADPSVSLSASPFSASAAGTPADFLTLNDKSVSSDVVMIDDITGEPTAEPAQFSGTCP